MDQVKLPLLHSNNKPEDAIDKMNEFKRRFVIAELGERGYHSFSNKQMLQAWRCKISTLGEMITGEPVVMVSVTESVNEIMSLPWGHAKREKARELMSKHSMRRFGLPLNIVVTGGLIDVLTQHEGVAQEATSATKDCLCKNCGFNKACPPASSFNPCPNCGKPTWRCA